MAIYRKDYLDACIEFADSLRVRERPDIEKLGEKVLSDCGTLVSVRDYIIDWILLEAPTQDPSTFSEVLIDFMEKLRDLKTRPDEISSWNDAWFEAHALFVYETFLYIIAALLKSGAYQALHEVFTSNYLVLDSIKSGEPRFERFDYFYAYSNVLQSVLAPEGRKLYSPAAALIKRQANRPDLPFHSIIEADLLALLMMFISPDGYWYPQTLHYAKFQYNFPFFVRCTQKKHFRNLSIITGISQGDALRKRVKDGHDRANVAKWNDFYFDRGFWKAMNLDKMDTLE